MASNINTTIIDTTYPIAGQDNDSQGFRDNFFNTNQNFIEAKSEIEALQNEEIIQLPAPAVATGAVGDLAGKISYDATYMYLCTADYTDGLSNIWIRTALDLTW